MLCDIGTKRTPLQRQRIMAHKLSVDRFTDPAQLIYCIRHLRPYAALTRSNQFEIGCPYIINPIAAPTLRIGKCTYTSFVQRRGPVHSSSIRGPRFPPAPMRTTCQIPYSKSTWGVLHHGTITRSVGDWLLVSCRLCGRWIRTRAGKLPQTQSRDW